MVFAIGEILYDIFPKYKRLGGAPFNFAFHINSFGLPVQFVSRIGKDKNGESILHSLNAWKFSNQGIQIDAKHGTGEVLIDVSNPLDPQYDIVTNRAYDHIAWSKEIASLLTDKVDLFYFGTLIQRSSKSRETIKKALDTLPEQAIKIYDINLRKNCYSREVITHSLERATVLKINTDELQTVKTMLGYIGNDQSFLSHLFTTFALEMICLTKGADGSTIYTHADEYSVAAPKVRSADSVGAGDAYTAVLAIGLLKKWPLRTVMKRATLFAKDICRTTGAIPQDPTFYSTYNHWRIGE